MLEKIGINAQNLRHRSTFDGAVELLIECGELESAVADLYCFSEECVTPQMGILRRLTINAAQILLENIRENSFGNLLDDFIELLAVLKRSSLPESIERRTQEGFAYYGLYPQLYIQAAERFFEQFRPQRAVCVGLRSIGTTLSAVVASVLISRGVNTDSFTLRPVGDPFDRQVHPGRGLCDSIITRSVYYLVVDEGPGLSGSSLCATAAKIESLGVSRSKIILFPSWIPDSSSFVCESARKRWGEYRKFTGDFNSLWGKLKERFCLREQVKVIEASAGSWREHLFKNSGIWPPANPFHERRKFFLKEGDGFVSVLKFAGLGRYQRETEFIARALEEASAPRVKGEGDGFIEYEFVGTLTAIEKGADMQLFRDAACYLSFRKRMFPCAHSATFDQIREMIEVNISKVGRSELLKKAQKAMISSDSYARGPVAVDSRMMPHKWIRGERCWRKVDGSDHFRDQFLPAAQDIAWDIAGFCTEFSIRGREREEFLQLYAEKSGDWEVKKIVNFYFLAYLAFRIGYSEMARNSLVTGVEAFRFGSRTSFYLQSLEYELSCF